MDNISYFGLYSFTCFQAVFIGSVIWFIFLTIYVTSAICTMFVQFQLFYNSLLHLHVEVEYFDDREPLTAVLAHFLCTCAETALFMLSVQHLLSPSFSSTWISYLYGNFCDVTTF